MKVHAINVSHTFGVSKKKDPNGKPYDMCVMQVLMPFDNSGGETKDGGHYTRDGFGYSIAEMPVQVDAFIQFKDVEFPAHIEVSTDSEVQFGRMVTVITGLIVGSGKAAKQHLQAA